VPLWPARELDEHGENVFREWVQTAAPEDKALVREVLAAFAGRQDVTAKWYSTRDLATGSLVVVPRPGLTVILQEFSDEDPRRSFSVIAIV
jgi:hypothetical protein